MLYKGIIEYLVANRQAVREDCEETKMSKEQTDVCLMAYDFAALQSVRLQQSYTLLKEQIIAKYGAKAFEEIEVETAKGFLTIGVAEHKYNMATAKDDKEHNREKR